MEPRIGKVQPWSERHGIGRDTIYALWRGREPQPDTLARIADAMGVSYDELLRVRAGLPAQDSQASDVVRAIDRQTEAIVQQTKMLYLVLSRLVPSEDEPEPDELAAQRMYDAQRRPRPVPDPVKP